jgi:hypothetical protein
MLCYWTFQWRESEKPPCCKLIFEAQQAGRIISWIVGGNCITSNSYMWAIDA